MKSTKEIIEEMVAICEREGLEHYIGENESELSCILEAVKAVMTRAYCHESQRLKKQEEEVKIKPPLYKPISPELTAALKSLLD